MAKIARSLQTRKTADAPAHEIWLAGLGARATADKDDPRLFRRLVARGRKVEASATFPFSSWEAPGPAPSSAAEAVATAAETAQLRRNAEARREFLAEFDTLTSHDIAEIVGSRAKNRAALANRWKVEGQIFAVEAGGQTLFPAFQLSVTEGQPLPIVAEILAALQPGFSSWQTALWLAGRNGWLGGKRPVDLLVAEPQKVAAAARRQSEAFD